ncbi:hypothetical protein INR49_020915, partial [Caranx melampygus]
PAHRSPRAQQKRSDVLRFSRAVRRDEAAAAGEEEEEEGRRRGAGLMAPRLHYDDVTFDLQKPRRPQLSVMEDLWSLAVGVFHVWMFVVVFFIMLPAMFGLSLGVTGVYIQILVRILEWATLRIQRGRQEQPSVPVPLPNGVESIVDDQVTQRFSSEELASWNLLTRTNQNFRYISLRLTVIWGVGVFVRYCVLFPLRITLAIIGLSWLVIGTTLVGFLPESSAKNWLSELVHLTCYRICARGLSATVHYHNKWVRSMVG